MRAGIQLLQQHGDVEEAFDLSPEQLCERIVHADALIIRSATQARGLRPRALLLCIMGFGRPAAAAGTTWPVLQRMSRGDADAEMQ
jgi:hypothetical protein